MKDYFSTILLEVIMMIFYYLPLIFKEQIKIQEVSRLFNDTFKMIYPENVQEIYFQNLNLDRIINPSEYCMLLKTRNICYHKEIEKSKPRM
ncbi:1109_t:CDS:1, partial [Gigaspora margarita]